jgi:hypothetical protein
VETKFERIAVEQKTAPIACFRCGAIPKSVVRTLLDSRKGRTFLILKCQCGKEIWREEA